MKKNQKIRALVLLSGGLDSLLASKLLLNLGIEVEGISFASPFWDLEKPKMAAQQLSIPLHVLDIEEEYLTMLKNPEFGYGKGFNPCIDCHALMFRKAFEFAQKNGFYFIATGEVLGERPFSQNLKALKIVAEKSGVGGYLLRPLSAKLLPPTIPEKEGWVDREKLLDLKGRSRKRQMELAQKWGIKEYPTPAGGCLLTDPVFSQRMRDLYKNWPDFRFSDAEILKYGRVFWEGKNLIVVGRHYEDNLKLQNLSKNTDILMKVKEKPGPTTLVRIKEEDKKETTLQKAATLTLQYAHLKNGLVLCKEGNKLKKLIEI